MLYGRIRSKNDGPPFQKLRSIRSRTHNDGEIPFLSQLKKYPGFPRSAFRKLRKINPPRSHIDGVWGLTQVSAVDFQEEGDLLLIRQRLRSKNYGV